MTTSSKKKIILSALAAIAVSLLIYAATAPSAHADINNPHSTPPNNSVTAAMLKGAIISDAQVTSNAAIAATKIAAAGVDSNIQINSSGVLSANSALKFLASGAHLIIGSGSVEASTTNFNGVPYTWPSSAGTNGNLLKTDGSGTLSWGAASTISSQTIITTTGTSTFSVPAGVTRVTVEVVGAGGAGGGGTASHSGGAGGGGGGYCFKSIDVTGTSTIQVYVGTGGTGTSGSAGTSGQWSTFGTNGFYCSASGGGPGQIQNNGAGSGGTGTGGDLNIQGSGGGGGSESLASSDWGGTGGSSHYGGGGATTAPGGGTGQAGGNYGGGGAGGANESGASTGGAGAPGLVIIKY